MCVHTITHTHILCMSIIYTYIHTYIYIRTWNIMHPSVLTCTYKDCLHKIHVSQKIEQESKWELRRLLALLVCMSKSLPPFSNRYLTTSKWPFSEARYKQEHLSCTCMYLFEYASCMNVWGHVNVQYDSINPGKWRYTVYTCVMLYVYTYQRMYWCIHLHYVHAIIWQ